MRLGSMFRIAPLILLILTLVPMRAQSPGSTLDIDPVFQETPEWCWVATGQMIFNYFDIPMINPDGQCGIVSLWGARVTPNGLFGPCMANCRACPFPAGQVATIKAMLQQYPLMAGAITRQPVAPLRFQGGAALTREQVRDEIDASRPILVGISPSGNPVFGPQHVALIVGYESDANDNLFLIVNDPFPFSYFAPRGIPDPYILAGGINVDAGRYRIEYARFRAYLKWTESIYRFRH